MSLYNTKNDMPQYTVYLCLAESPPKMKVRIMYYNSMIMQLQGLN